ncbi:carboxypeptidase regulatory-like domain-containing protein [Flavobacteriales bacterium]|nr:carboxypeptidase regulatory-like domain-containing protein [Flavobacteriales bacterium]
MLRKIYSIVALVCFSTFAFAQTGTLKGVISDVMTGETIPFANVVIEKGGDQYAGTTTDFDGKYTIKPIEPGNYSIKATFVGYQTVEVTGVIVSANKITFQDVKLQEGVALGEIKIIEYKKPLLDQDNLSGETKTAEEIVALPTRNVSSVASTTAGIYQKDEGDAVNMRGSRENATAYYVDGIKVRGAIGVPTSGIEQITVVTGGLPAQYGDATGGIIAVTTKGPSNKFFGGIEVESSSLFDKYNYNLVGFGLSGPIIKKRNSDGTKGSSILGYFLSGEFRDVDDTDPSAIGRWKVKDDVLTGLQQTPFQIAPNANAGFLSTSDFLSEDDFENVQARINSNEKRFNISGKLDFKPTNTTFLSLGGALYSRTSRDFSGWRSMFSSANNRESSQTTYRLFGKLTQKFGSEESNEENSSAAIKNAFFTIQGDYTNNQYTFVDADHQFDLFKYGYVGEFNTYKANIYNGGSAIDSTTGIIYTGQIHSGWGDTLYTFKENQFTNADLANYTNAYYQMFEDYGLASFVGAANDGVIRTAADLKGQGLRNGNLPASVYSLFGNHGTMYNGSAEQENTQTSFKASGSADIKDHEFSFGFEFEQRDDSYWGMGPMGMWGLMRQQANKHILQRDLSNPLPVYDINGVYQDTVNFDRLYVAEEQSWFDRSLREKLGLLPNSTDYIDIDALSPETFDIKMFSPDELLNSGSSLVYYYGYDIHGSKLTNNPTLKDFFVKKDANGNYLREIASFQPIYTAGYIQDKFAIEDLIFNVGLRIDRYDANQKVLSDKYLLHQAYTKGNQNPSGTFWDDLAPQGHPSTIGDDYVVYVDDVSNPSSIVGYRDNETWYNADGLQISDPNLLAEAAGGQIQPYLTDAQSALEGTVNVDNVFDDYTPETVFMPRIAFSFPISDEAQFFAHYDVLTQRPPQSNRLEPVDYLFMADRVGALLNNPDLKSEKTVDYELGFAKTLSLRSALKISAFYKELRDMIQVVNVLGAYPAQYLTYGNIDFGTVKGMSVNFDLRRTGNISMTANYTLQFADGTGSSASSGQSLVNTGQPNLRSTIPLAFDQRHAISASVDYRYGSGKDYDGPILFGKNIFANAGANMVLSAGSGTPYSKQSNITQEAADGINDRSTLEGSLNGSRLPWQFRISAKFNKEFEIKWSDKKSSNVNVYVQIQNLLDAKNIISVYRATGNPDDDGYLTSSAAQNAINAQNSPDSFRNMYSLAVNNPNNYSLPRMLRAGLSFEF